MNIDTLREMVRVHFDAPKNYYTVRKRTKEVVWPRHALRYLLREHFGINHTKVAKLTGATDHTTAIHSINVVKDQMHLGGTIGKGLETLLFSVKAITDAEAKPNGYGFPSLEQQ
jgi:chromosomal replication initiation ATPase DnaA